MGPVFSTDLGKPAGVFLSMADDQLLLGPQSGVAELLVTPEAASLEFDPPKVLINSRPADLS